MFRKVSLSALHIELLNNEIVPLEVQWGVLHCCVFWRTFIFNLQAFINETSLLTKWVRNLKLPAWEFHIIHLIL